MWGAHLLPESGDMKRRRFLYILALAGCIVFYGAYQKWFSWIVLLAVLALPWFSLLLSLRAMLGTRLRLTVPERVVQGTRTVVKLEVRCPVPQVPYRGGIRVTKPITGESWILRSGDSLPTEHCGGLILRLEKASVYDYLGLFSIKLRRPPVCVVRVMPKRTELPVPEELPQYTAKAWRPKQVSVFAENHEIRQYQPGDPLTLVHWKLSAKTEEMMLREPMEPDCGMIRLIMDLCGTPDELDRKFARLQCFGDWLLGRGVSFQVLALTGKGTESWSISGEWEFGKCVDALMCAPFAPDGSIRERNTDAGRVYIGGDPYEAEA